MDLYRILSNFVREGRANRLPLLHGPNGSAKSTVARCLMLALEHYSKSEDGALYRFHWVFPSRKSTRGAIGFGEKGGQFGDAESYALIGEDQIDARLVDEIRDHPLFLLPGDERRKLLKRLYGEAEGDGGPRVNQWLWQGQLSHKNRAVFDALLSSYEGNLGSVLKHVQVERYFISQRYRTGAVTVGPELSVDASERQVTADRSLSALPTSLQTVALFESHGELIEASGGILEFSDLLKRPLDAFKYLQLTVETGEVPLPSQTIRTNCVMLASANEVELAAFRKHHEFESFRSRVELIRAGYLKSWQDERVIYDTQVAAHIQKHVVPHATAIAAMFAVLTRLTKPDPDKYPREVRDVIRSLTALEKLDLYTQGTTPERLDAEKSKALSALVPQLYSESDAQTHYEGFVGASPREMRTVLLDAAQSSHYFGLSPFAVLDQLDRLCSREVEYTWLQLEVRDGGYHDHAGFRKALRVRLLSWLEDEFRVASGLVDEARYQDLFDRYIHHVSHWSKREKVKNPLTGDFEDPDEHLMEEVEALLDLPDSPSDLRHSWMNRIAAWAIDHPGEPISNGTIFARAIRRLRDAVFQERRQALARLCRHVVTLLRGQADELSHDERGEAQRMLDRLCAEFGYQPDSVVDSAVALLRERLDAN
jgi:predicted Ser/Thr protein kinase